MAIFTIHLDTSQFVPLVISQSFERFGEMLSDQAIPGSAIRKELWAAFQPNPANGFNQVPFNLGQLFLEPECRYFHDISAFIFNNTQKCITKYFKMKSFGANVLIAA